MRIIFWTSIALVGLVTSILIALVFLGMPSISEPNLRRIDLGENVVLLGRLENGTGTGARFFSLRVGDRQGHLPGNVPFQLSFEKRIYRLGTLTTDDVLEMGGEVSTPDYGDAPDRVRHGFIGWGQQNRDGGLEFYFLDGQLTEFYARWHLRASSPFAIIAESGDTLTFPFNDEDLIDAFGESIASVDVVAK